MYIGALRVRQYVGKHSAEKNMYNITKSMTKCKVRSNWSVFTPSDYKLDLKSLIVFLRFSALLMISNKF